MIFFITSKETFEEIKNLYLKENISIYHLSKQFNVAINSIKNFLKKTNDYMPKLNNKQSVALQELVDQAQELGMGY